MRRRGGDGDGDGVRVCLAGHDGDMCVCVLVVVLFVSDVDVGGQVLRLKRIYALVRLIEDRRLGAARLGLDIIDVA